jgi:hypothetical protein
MPARRLKRVQLKRRKIRSMTYELLALCGSGPHNPRDLAVERHDGIFVGCVTSSARASCCRTTPPASFKRRRRIRYGAVVAVKGRLG